MTNTRAAGTNEDVGWATLLKTTRKSKGLTQEQLADAANVARNTVIRQERGEFTPDSETLKKICDVLGINYGQALKLVHGADDAEPLPPPLPAPLARLVDIYNDMAEADRLDLLNHVDMVNEWGEVRLARAAVARRGPRRTG